MRMKLTYPRELTNSADNFANAIVEWFELLKTLPDKPWGINEMTQLTPGLARLCVLAYLLPKISDYEDEEPSRLNNDYDFVSIRIDFAEEYKHYYTLFFPYEGTRKNRECRDIPVISELVDDMYDICNDLQDGLEYYKKGMTYRAVYLWRVLFLSHWGEHASQALYAMDHAMRDYMCDEDMGKHEDPADNMYYPAVKYTDIDGFFIVRIPREESNLPYEIVINSLGMKDDDIPMIGVIVEDMVAFISVSEEPAILSRVPIPGYEVVFEWIIKHQVVLKQHWRGEIDDRELLTALYGKD